MTVQTDIRELGQIINKLVSHGTDTRGFFLQVFSCQRDCSSQTDNSRNIFSRGTFAALLGTAMHELVNARALTDIQCTNTLGAMEFVRGEGKHVTANLLDIDRDRADCLYGIRVEINLMLLRNPADLFDRLKRSNLIVSCHNGDQNRLIGDGCFDIFC